METCVLIPQEFSLCVRGPSNRMMASAREPEVSVWTNSMIAQGALCYPFQGTIRLDKLEVYGQLDDDDVSKLLRDDHNNSESSLLCISLRGILRIYRG